MDLKPHEIRFAGRKGEPRDPRREKLRDYRDRWRIRYHKENKYARKFWNRKNRRRTDRAIRSASSYEDIDIVLLRKTCGWWTH